MEAATVETKASARRARARRRGEAAGAQRAGAEKTVMSHLQRKNGKFSRDRDRPELERPELWYAILRARAACAFVEAFLLVAIFGPCQATTCAPAGDVAGNVARLVAL
jgi:hypothetical protein